MSSAIVRQALEFVDEEECVNKGKKCKKQLSKRARDHRAAGQDFEHRLLKKRTKRPQDKPKSKEEIAEENIRKLLKLSKSVASKAVAEKIVERAVKGKALSDYIEVKQAEEDKPVLFTEETFKEFEKGYFCS